MYVDNEKKKKTKPQVKKFLKKRKKDSTFTFGGGVRLNKKVRGFQSSNSLCYFPMLCHVTID